METNIIQQLFSAETFEKMGIFNFLINMFVVWLMVHFLYYRNSRRRDFYFTFILLGVAIYFLVFFMIFVLEDMKGKTGIGIGIGLFGIFSIMRYRTDAMPVREMTYLFLIVCLSVVHAMAEDYGELVVIDIITLVAIVLCEHVLKVQNTKLIQYDRIELIKPEKREELIADLEQRTGLKILKVDVGGIDFLKDTAVLRITFEGDNDNNVNGQFQVRKSQWRSEV